MSLDYFAKLLTKEDEDKLKKDITKEKLGHLFDQYLSEEKLQIGLSTDAWIFSAINLYLATQGCYPERGSLLGQALVKKNDFLEFIMPHDEAGVVLNKIQNIHAENDGNFINFLKETFNKWEKEGYAETAEEYLEGIQSLKVFIEKCSKEGKGLIVLIPY